MLRKYDSDAVRIKAAMLLPSVFVSAEDMKLRWDDMLVRLKALLKRPKLTLPRDAYVSSADRSLSSYLLQLDVGTSTFFYLAFTGWDNKEHMLTIGKVRFHFRQCDS